MIEIENSVIDAEKIELEVEPENERAIAFYTKYGFKTVGETENCGEHSSGIRALIMEKEIVYAEE